MKHTPFVSKSADQPRKLAALKQAWQEWTTSPDILARLTRRLSTTLSLENQLTIFAEEAATVVPFDSLQYRHHIAKQDFVFSTGLGGPHRAEYRLNLEGAHFGTLTLLRRQRFTEEELGGIEMLIGTAICPIRNACQFIALEQTARTDALTGIPNKRALDEDLARTSHLSDRHQETYSLILLDLDHFKAVNDIHGHLVGDQILRLTAESMERTLRVSDSIFRFGGEEFAVLLPHTASNEAREVADRLREAVTNTIFERGDIRVGVTASCGVSTHMQGESAEQWLTRADEALYRAKREGRNQTRISATISGGQ